MEGGRCVLTKIEEKKSGKNGRKEIGTGRTSEVGEGIFKQGK